MLIWKPPAALILFGTMAVLAMGVPALLIFGFGYQPESDAAVRALAEGLWGAGILVADGWYRKASGLSPFDLSRSTVFFILPTWAVGVLLLLVAAKGG